MKKGIVLISIIFILIGCTKKNNPTGFNSTFDMKTKTINWQNFDRAYSYEDSIKNSDSINLITGKFNNVESKILLKFKSFPDSVFQVQNTMLKMTINKKFNFDNPIQDDIKIGLLQTDWKESKATWFTTGDTIEWKNSSAFSDEDYTLFELDSFGFEDDTLSVTFDDNIVKNWINADTLNFGLVIFTQKDSSFLYFNSSEAGSDELKPTLSFDYKITETDTIVSHYSKAANYDTFIYHKVGDENLAYFNNDIKLSGMMPTASFIHFNISDTMFINDPQSGIFNENDYHRITVLRAELYLYPEEQNSFPAEGNMSIRPYLVISDSVSSDNPTLPLDFGTDYISYGKTTVDTLNATMYKIDVTYAVQSIISGTYTNTGVFGECKNYGIVLKTLKENLSYEYLNFLGLQEADETKRPKLVIKYVAPNFDY